jgi:hypothetical protein
MGGGNLADQKPAKNPPGANNTIDYINKIGRVELAWKARLGCLAQDFDSFKRAILSEKRLPPSIRSAAYITGAFGGQPNPADFK